MSANDPQPSPDIQMTPVSFGPAQTGEEIGTIVPPPRAPYQYPVFWPVFIILLTLIFSTVRDMVTVNQRIMAINEQEKQPLEILKESGSQADFISSMRKDLGNLATSDPVAARIFSEYFPPPSASKKESPSDSSKVPSK